MSHEVDLKRRYIDAFDFAAGANVDSLDDRFDVEAYLTPHSDVVAIMVLTHPTTRMRITGPVERLLRTMLFVGAAPLGGTVRGTSSFAEDFHAQGPRDGEGRSLRDFDLESRLFRYPLSFLVHSEAFGELPEVARRLFARRLVEVLGGEDEGADLDHLTPGDREAILEIPQTTEPGLLALASP